MDLSFSDFWAEDDDGSSQDWDSTDLLRVEYQIDGGRFDNLFGIRFDGSGFNTPPSIDTDFDGIGDGSGITATFTAYTQAISGTGSSLDLRITMDLNSGDETLIGVPEPAVACLGAFGFLVILRRRR